MTTPAMAMSGLCNPVFQRGRGLFCKNSFRIRSSYPSGKEGGGEPTPPAAEFTPLAAVFRRRLLVGTGTASILAFGANFLGLTSFLLGFEPEFGRKLRVDAIYPIGGYSRCLETNNGFEFIYPASWVGDQALLSRDMGRSRSSDPVVAFGPPGSNGELNVSVIVSPVPPSFSMEAFGGAKEVGQAVVKNISGNSQMKADLVESKSREDDESGRGVKYYELEFAVESPSFRRHDVAVCCVSGGKLLTLNAQAPESAWPEVKEEFYKIAGSFRSFSDQT